MIHPFLNTNRIALFLVLVLAFFSTVLVAQNIPKTTTTPSKEAAPAGVGQVQTEAPTQANNDKFQTFTGEEYVVYEKNGQTYFYDPSTDTETSKVTTVNLWDIRYQSNLGKEVEVSVKHETREGGQKFTISTIRQVSSNGNVITKVGYGGEPVVSVVGYPDFVLKNEHRTGLYGEYTVESIPYGWLNQTHLLVAKGNIANQYAGLFSVDIVDGTQKEILPGNEYKEGRTTKQYYVEVPSLSPSGRYLLYQKPIGVYDTHDGGETELIIYDLQTGHKKKICDNGFPKWFTTKEVSQGPGDPGFSFSLFSCDAPTCGGEAGLTFKLPFKCGEAYRVTRDGECFNPAECNYGDGGYPVATWNQSVEQHHEGKKAIDFSDNYLGGTFNDDLPVLAGQAGKVVYADWDDLDHLKGAGLCVWIKHLDGYYTLYGHMKVGSLQVVLNQQVSQGQTLGTEGSTGASSAQHIHFARSITTSGAGPNSRWMTFDELGAYQIPTDEHIYISQNGSCSMPCVNGGTLPVCGGVFSGSTTGSDSRATYFVTTSTGGNLATVNESGPEKMYQITPSNNGIMTAKLTNSSNQSVIFMSGNNCSNLNPLINCTGTAGTSTNSYTASCNVTANTTYFIVVDGVNGAAGSYTLTVTPPCVQANLTDYGSTRSNSGRNLTLNMYAVNWGPGNAGAFVTRIWLSTDTYLENGNDYYIAYVNYPNGIASGYYSTSSGTIPIPSSVPAGNYYVLIKIDYITNNWSGAVVESNENDNAFYLGPGTTFYLPPSFSGGADDRSNIDPIELRELSTAQGAQSNPTAVSLDRVQSIITCTAIVNGYKISSTAEAGSEYLLTNNIGQIVCHGKAESNEIACEVSNSGIYFLSIIDSSGNRCTQKVFVN